MCDVDAIGVPSIFKTVVIRSVPVLTRMSPTLDLICENTGRVGGVGVKMMILLQPNTKRRDPGERNVTLQL